MDRHSSHARIVGRLAAAMLTAAATLSPLAASAKDRQLVIGVAMARQAQQRWAVDAFGMQQEADRLGVKLIFAHANDDPTKQASQVENMLSQQIDALILHPANTNTAGPMIDSAHDAKIPVVAYDSNIANAKADYLVTRDYYKVGVLQAEGALAFAPKGNYAVIEGDPIWAALPTVKKGYEDTLKGKDGVKIVFDQIIAGFSPSVAMSSAENALSANSDNISAFIVLNDGMGSAVVQALDGRNLAGKVYVSGLDGETASLKLVASGKQSMTIYSDIVDTGASAVRAAVALAKGETPQSDTMTKTSLGDIPTHLTPMFVVTKANMCESLKKMPPQWTTVEQVMGDAKACP